MALFPGALPAAGAASPSDTLAAAGHTSLHNTGADESRAIATKVGTGASTPADNSFLVGNGAGTSSWETASTARSSMGLGSLAILSTVDLTANVTGVLPVANGGTGTTTSTGSGSTVLSSSPTIVTPTIASFANANHNHEDAAGGGQLGTEALLEDSVTPDILTPLYVTAHLSATWTSAASATWQDSGFDVTLPTIGTWVLLYNLRIQSPSNLNDYAVARLYNETTSAVVTDSHRISYYPTGAAQVTIPLSEIVETEDINTVIRVELLPNTTRAVSLVADTNGTTNVIAWRIG